MSRPREKNEWQQRKLTGKRGQGGGEQGMDEEKKKERGKRRRDIFTHFCPR
jgi:hypothetical protein